MTIMNETSFLILRGKEITANQLDPLRVILIVNHRVAVRKSTSLHVLPRKTDIVTFLK